MKHGRQKINYEELQLCWHDFHVLFLRILLQDDHLLFSEIVCKFTAKNIDIPLFKYKQTDSNLYKKYEKGNFCGINDYNFYCMQEK